MLHVSKTDSEMPRDRPTTVIVELSLEFIFVSHTKSLSCLYFTTIQCTRVNDSKGHDVPTFSLEDIGDDSSSSGGDGFTLNCVIHCLVRFLRLLSTSLTCNTAL